MSIPACTSAFSDVDYFGSLFQALDFTDAIEFFPNGTLKKFTAVAPMRLKTPTGERPVDHGTRAITLDAEGFVVTD